ncbi:PilZ domain-containing protein [Leptolyngbya cf. ectocarpi LEGE 11479]|uniref:PilZ domain-containing protein n=1 Tax=Leptolyngbya cf. ectocarpi LEGE 11479 TaxID=1828722 RepID=A0A928ZTN4_LEPEC|nr:PilZ domain-containing protein [Leptolyngbya ectocarpi]MBE9066389.1 PilZ domain-containing protein [Leptolyngbya cf. ectocarpi LEGE 11479]
MNQAASLKQQNVSAEQRRFPRKRKILAYQIGGLFSSRKPTVDISRGGTCIYSDKRLAIGKRLNIKFFAKGQKIVAKAQVVRVKVAKANAPAKYEIGLKFAEISEQQLDLLLSISGKSVLNSPSPVKMMLGTAATVCIATASTPAAAQVTNSNAFTDPEISIVTDFDFLNLNGPNPLIDLEPSQESSESVPEPGVLGGLAVAGIATLVAKRRKR